MYNLFLDDMREPKNVRWLDLPPVSWVIIRNYDEFKKIILEKGLPNIVSLDHDLADSHYKEYEWAHDDKNINKGKFNYDNCKEKTGFDCAKFLVEYCLEKNLDLPIYFVHSMNYIGKENIISIFESYKKCKDVE